MMADSGGHLWDASLDFHVVVGRLAKNVKAPFQYPNNAFDNIASGGATKVQTTPASQNIPSYLGTARGGGRLLEGRLVDLGGGAGVLLGGRGRATPSRGDD